MKEWFYVRWLQAKVRERGLGPRPMLNVTHSAAEAAVVALYKRSLVLRLRLPTAST